MSSTRLTRTKSSKAHKSKYRSFERTLKPSASLNCLNKTMPTTVPVHNNSAHPRGRHAQSTTSLMANPHQHHEESHTDAREHSHSPPDASNLAYPVNPFDHLMPHKNDYGTPNMAWIGEDGLVHTPRGGVYAKTTEAVANFRRTLKYDNSWHRTRQRFICLLLLIMFSTVVAVIVLLIPRLVLIDNIRLMHAAKQQIWAMADCPHELNGSAARGCNVTLSPALAVRIDNRNWVPATVNAWRISHTLFCSATLACPPGGVVIGTAEVADGRGEVLRKSKGVVDVKDDSRFVLPSCELSPDTTIDGSYCMWYESCQASAAPGHFLVEMEIEAELSFALQTLTRISETVRLGVFCRNGTGVVCQVGATVTDVADVCS